MKYLALILILVGLVGCTGYTEYGSCIGVMDKQDPEFNYEVSGWNALIAIVFSETIVIPIYTVAKDIQCPYGRK